MHPINLSVAVWVGFIALFGIATDDGVVMATYLTQTFDRNTPDNKKEVRASVVEAGEKRIRPCLMTTATTILALLPVLTSTGRGSDIMIPMAIPSFGGMLIALITLFVVPVLYSWKAEFQLKRTVKMKQYKSHIKSVFILCSLSFASQRNAQELRILHSDEAVIKQSRNSKV